MVYDTAANCTLELPKCTKAFVKWQNKQEIAVSVPILIWEMHQTTERNCNERLRWSRNLCCGLRDQNFNFFLRNYELWASEWRNSKAFARLLEDREFGSQWCHSLPWAGAPLHPKVMDSARFGLNRRSDLLPACRSKTSICETIGVC